MKRHLIFATIAAALLTACGSDADAPGADAPEREAVVTAAIGQAGASRAAESSWLPGDRIGISGTSGSRVYANRPYSTADGSGNFAPDGPDGIYIQDKTTARFTAYHPFTGVDGSTPAAIAGNTRADMQTASVQPSIDWLWAETTADYTDPRLDFSFTHRMSRLSLTFVSGEGVDVASITGYTLGGLAMEGTFDPSTGTARATGQPEALSIKDLTVASGKALPSLILYPQTPAGEVTVSTMLDGTTYSCSLPLPELTAGKDYRFTITAGKTGLTIGQSTISEWADGGSFNGDANLMQGYWIDNSGTYIVTAEEGLTAWSEALKADHSIDCRLEADIVLPDAPDGGSNWKPIGGDEFRYTGTFDGNGHTISNLRVEEMVNYNAGFIGRLGTPGTIKNLIIENSSIEGIMDIGAFVGNNRGTISNCILGTGCTVIGNKTGDTGGITGFNSSGTIDNCHLLSGSAVMGMTESRVGGITAYNDHGTISNCSMERGSTVSGKVVVGGIAGVTMLGNVTACYALGTVVGEKNESASSRPPELHSHIGGICGSINYATMWSCYSDCSFTGETNVIIGAITGQTAYQVGFTASYWSGTENGIGNIFSVGDVTGGPILVNGTDVTIQMAVDEMNAALPANWEYVYQLDGSTPVLVKK